MVFQRAASICAPTHGLALQSTLFAVGWTTHRCQSATCFTVKPFAIARVPFNPDGCDMNLHLPPSFDTEAARAARRAALAYLALWLVVALATSVYIANLSTLFR